MTLTRKKLGPVLGLGLSLSLLAACSGGSASNDAAQSPSSSVTASADSSSSSSTSSDDNEDRLPGSVDSSPASSEEEDHSGESLAQQWARKRNRASGQDSNVNAESDASSDSSGRRRAQGDSELSAGRTPENTRENGSGQQRPAFEVTPDTALAHGESDAPIPPAQDPSNGPGPFPGNVVAQPAEPKPAQPKPHPTPEKPGDGTGKPAPKPHKPGKPSNPAPEPGSPKPGKPGNSHNSGTVTIAAFDEEGYNSALASWKRDRDEARSEAERSNRALDDARRTVEAARDKADASQRRYEEEKAKLDELVAAMPGTGDLAQKRDLAAKLKVEAEKAAADVETAEKKVTDAEKKKQDADRKLEQATKQLEVLSDKRDNIAIQSNLEFAQLNSEDQLRALSDALAERVNDYRVKNGRNELVYAPVFNDKAAGWSTTMATSTDFTHSNRDEEGYSSENIVAATCSTEMETVDECADALFEQWQKSDDQNKNMLDETFSHAGMGLAKGDDGQVYGTNMFFIKDDVHEANSTTVVPKSKGMPENLDGEYVPEGAIAVTGGTKLAHTVDDRNTAAYDKWEGGKDGLDYTKGVRRGVDKRISELEEAPRVDELKNLDSDISEAQAKVDAAQAEADQSNQDLEDAKRAKGDADIRKTESEDASSKAQADLAEAEAAAPEAETARKQQQAKVDNQSKIVGEAESNAARDNKAASDAENELNEAQAKADDAKAEQQRVEAQEPTKKDYTTTIEVPAE
ncbi:CAP domain-containing protein [Dermabacter vaginalis]|uniref:CAP domain-containing protein n=1 Tax=Dermabacter vaginalis TaxID=1630135 RepID=UPI001EF5317C|nr:CAP domain-containing protein [Dermabacter vaginalis]MCG7442730.1 CAP domain-containing protein [Dermabacter vaginalis]